MMAPASVIETKLTTADGTVYSALLISGEILVLQAYNQGEPIEKVRQSFCFEDEKEEEDYCKGIKRERPSISDCNEDEGTAADRRMARHESYNVTLGMD